MGGSGLQQGHVGREEELAAAVLAEEDRQEDSGRAALVKGRGHLVEHGVHLEAEDHPAVSISTGRGGGNNRVTQ